MSEGLSALLGCVQSEVSQSSLSGGSEPQIRRLMQKVVLPTPPSRTQVVILACKYCQQHVRVRVSSRSTIWQKRLLARVSLAVSVCLWVAAVALSLVYFLDAYPAMPGREVALAGFLVVLGVVVWTGVDPHDAFGSDLAIGCRIERPPEAKTWERWISPQARSALPRHVLLDLDQEFAPHRLPAGSGRHLAEAPPGPGANPTAAASGGTPRAASGSPMRITRG